MSHSNNPLMRCGSLPDFASITPAHAEPAIASILQKAQKELDTLEKEAVPTWAGVMQPAYRLHEPLDYAWSLVCHFMSVMNSDDWRKAHESLQPGVVEFYLRLGQSEPVYKAMTALQDGPEFTTLTGPQKRILESSIRGARLSGVGLATDTRNRFNEIEQRLCALSTDFSNHLLDARKSFFLLLEGREDISGLPESLLQTMAQAARSSGHPQATADSGPWKLTIDLPVFMPFMKYSTRRDLREKLYRTHITLGSQADHDNGPLVPELLALRMEKAGILGFTHYAELSLASKMASGVTDVLALLDELRRAAYPKAEGDLATLQAFAAEHGQAEPLQLWDIAFWSERLRDSLFEFNDETLRPYFQFPRVLDGLFALAERLFAIKITAADGDAPVWHPDVRYFRVVDGDGKPLSSFYLDPYSRPDTKRGGAWMQDALPRDETGPAVKLPLVYLVCNQTVPTDGQPSLMTFSEIETLFHEFGHGLQHMLTAVGEPEASGINNIEWDAVELASQFMENWCYHRTTLQGMSAHVDDGSTLPDDLFDKIQAARTFQSGSATLRQLYFGFLDMRLHSEYDSKHPERIDTIIAETAKTARVLPLHPEDRSLCAFSHIFGGGYAAGYYSYKWSEVLSADAFAAFEEAGLDNDEAVRHIGRRYRDTVLALGGGTDPATVFRMFRGRDPDPKALLRQDNLV